MKIEMIVATQNYLKRINEVSDVDLDIEDGIILKIESYSKHNSYKIINIININKFIKYAYKHILNIFAS